MIAAVAARTGAEAFGGCAAGVPAVRYYGAVEIVVVVVVVGVNSDGRGVLTEQLQIFRVLAHQLRRTLAADVAVEAVDGVGFRHHPVQVVGHHQHPQLSSSRSWAMVW